MAIAKNSLENYKNDLIVRLIGTKNLSAIKKFKNMSDVEFFKLYNKKQDNVVRQVKDDETKYKKIGVYVKTNLEGYVIDINSDVFIKDFTGWTKIDEGYGDNYAHAQSKYFGQSLVNEKGHYRYKI